MSDIVLTDPFNVPLALFGIAVFYCSFHITGFFMLLRLNNTTREV